MFKNYLKIALRNLKKQKVFTLINISGLAIGMAGFAIFALTAGIKLNADRFHKDAEQIFALIQIIQDEKGEENHSGFLPSPLLPIIEEDIPEIEQGTRIMSGGQTTLKFKDKIFYENHVLFTDKNFLNFFTFEMISDQPETALLKPHSIVLSERAAKKYFGNEDPLGKTLTLDRNTLVTVTGVTKNIKKTSSLKFDFLVSLETIHSLDKRINNWTQNRFATFVKLQKNTDRTLVENKLSGYIKTHFPQSELTPKRLYLFPFLDMRLGASHINSIINSSHPAAVYALLFFGILLLLVVSINFINLSIARYMQRYREVALRKVIGAKRGQLIQQFLGESLLISFLAVPAAILIYETFQPLIQILTGGAIPIAFPTEVSNSIWHYPFLIKYLIIAALIIGVSSGLYPALYMSKFSPVQTLQKRIKSGKTKIGGKKILIIFQFTVSIILMALAGILKNQGSLILTSDMGFNRKNVSTIQVSKLSPQQRNILKTEIARNPEVISVSASSRLPVVWSNNQPVKSSENLDKEAVTMDAYGVDYNFIKTLEMKILQGRSFSPHRGDENNLVLNKSAVSKLPWENPLGKSITMGERSGIVIGIVNDFIFDDWGFEIPPAVLYIEKENLDFLLVKHRSSTSFTDIQEKMKNQWQSIVPDLPFICSTLDGYFLDMFDVLEKTSGLFNLVAWVAILFSCLGLFGLTSYIVEQKTKEIGIRKVLGASRKNIFWNLGKKFFLLVVIALFIALPLIFYAWNKVLQTGLLFITKINPIIYCLVAFIALIIAFIAVFSQTWKAATANPVESLRYE
ncbi:MAG: FtsX-like permease family protein [bacterium]